MTIEIMAPTFRPALAGWLLATLLCLLFAFAAISRVWPPLGGDAAMHFPPAVEVARGNAFEIPTWPWPLDDSVDNGGRRFVIHGFLHALVVGHLAACSGGTATACLAWAYAILVLAAGAAGAAMLAWWRAACDAPPVLSFALAFFAVTGSFALGFAWFGRMEPLAMLIASLGLLAWRLLPGTQAMFSAGLAIGALFFTSPVCGVLGGCAAAAAMALREDASNAPGVGAALLGGMLAAASSVAVYPYSLGDWIHGLSSHGRLYAAYPCFSGFGQTWIFRPHVPFLAVAMILLLVVTVRGLRSSLAKLGKVHLTVCLIALFGFTAVLFRVSVVKSEAAYNAVVWFPMLSCVALAGPRSKWSWVAVAVCMAFALPTAGLTRSAILLGSAGASEPSFEEVRQVVKERQAEGVMLSYGLFMAAEDMHAVSFGRPSPGAANPPWFVDQQLASGLSQPRAYESYELVKNCFGPPVKFMGVPLSRTPTGWQYALYRRVEPR